MSRFIQWTPDDAPAVIVDTTSKAGWDRIRSEYAPFGPVAPLERLIEVAQSHGVVSVLVERRYIDADYRSEHSRFYSTTFRRFPSVCHRLHFFTSEVPGDLTGLGELQSSYVGYSVMRPFETAPVGRTMIAPPPDMSGAVVCLATDRVHVFGCDLTVDAVPFISQDAQYLVCAHASEWMVLYHAHLLHGLPRRLPSDIHDAAVGGNVVNRQLPSMGLSLGQMLSSLHKFGLSPGRLLLPDTRADSRARGSVLSLPAVLCRYVNSQMPPIVVSNRHAWVVVGYRIEGTGPAHDNVFFYRHDDAAGPYIRVDDPWGEPQPQHRPWLFALPPLPQKCYLTPEVSEALARQWMASAITRNPHTSSVPDVTFRTYGISAVAYKRGLAARGLPAEIAQAYRLLQWPRYLWVTEAIDRTALDAGSPPVLGELILDSTAHQYAGPTDLSPLLALHIAGEMVSQGPDYGLAKRVSASSWVPYSAGYPAARV